MKFQNRPNSRILKNGPFSGFGLFLVVLYSAQSAILMIEHCTNISSELCGLTGVATGQPMKS